MAAKRDYYEVLGISKSADAGMIKKAYRKLAKKYHPDTNAGNPEAEKKFKEITEAYTILSDPEKKKLYDQFGHAAFDGSMPEGGFGSGQNGTYNNFYGGSQGNGSWSYTGPDGSYREYHFGGGDADDMFDDIFGNIFHNGKEKGQSFGKGGFGGFGSGFRSGSYQRKGADLHAEVTVGFEEAVFGCDKIIRLQNPAESGGGIQSLQVHIPAGIATGKSIRLRGKGGAGSGGGEPGDLLLKVTVEKKQGYERKDKDVYTTVNIPFTTAVFGGEVTVNTLYGNVICKIRPGTQSGTKIRLKGKGIVDMNNPNVHGDQYVSVQIQVPRNLNPQARQKLKEFEQACGQNTGSKGAA